MKSKLGIDQVYMGDLVFIINREKPTKTGWWRKCRDINKDGAEISLYLEKPMHKDFNAIELVKTNSRCEDGVFKMKPNTVSFDAVHGKKYEILFIATGIAGIKLVQNNYIPLSEFFYTNEIRYDFYYTERGMALFKYWRGTHTEDDLKFLASSLITRLDE